MHLYKYSPDLDLMIIDTDTALDLTQDIKSSTPLAVYIIDNPDVSEIFDIISRCNPDNSFKAPAGMVSGIVKNCNSKALSMYDLELVSDRGYNPLKFRDGERIIWGQNVLGVNTIINGTPQTPITKLNFFLFYMWLKNIDRKEDLDILDRMIAENTIEFNPGYGYFKTKISNNISYYKTPEELLYFMAKIGRLTPLYK